MDESLKERVRGAPTQPGCYLFTDKYGYIIYVGKAKNLRSRVKTYFTKAAAEDERTAELVPKIVSVEYRTVPTELDALMLEYHLIKQHKPWFNSQMKADKQRSYLRIGTDGRYPTLSAVTEKQDDGAAYFDCFTDEEDIKLALGLLCRVWKVPQCGAASFSKLASPCLYHSIAGCLAPCAAKADPAELHGAVKEILRFMSGVRVRRLAVLKKEMATRAEDLDFEAAGQIKEQLDQLGRLQRKSRKIYHFPDTGDVLVLARPFREPDFSAFLVRDGVAHSRADFSGIPLESQLADFMAGWDSDGGLEPWVAGSLTSISADKAFIHLRGEPQPAQVMVEMEKFCRRKRRK